MTLQSTKPKILTVIGNFLPGYKAGGILRTIVNTIDHLSEEYEFWVITRDRDVGDDAPYPNVEMDEWQSVGNAMVYYVSSSTGFFFKLLEVIRTTSHDLIYINSFFDPYAISTLLIRRLSLMSRTTPVIIAPRGEFAWGSLRLKYPKKLAYIYLSKMIGLYSSNVIWLASSELEAADINKVLRISNSYIQICRDLPSTFFHTKGGVDDVAQEDTGTIKIIFLSRISREKNLDYALNVVSRVKVKVSFDVYGPLEDRDYWNECQKYLSLMPENVTVRYCGPVCPDEVVQVFNRYDLFLFPSAGENYGHVIAESLISGTPVLTSTLTPWRGLEAQGLGWDLDLANINSFIECIESLSTVTLSERFKKRDTIREKIKELLLNSAVLDDNRRFFANALKYPAS